MTAARVEEVTHGRDCPFNYRNECDDDLCSLRPGSCDGPYGSCPLLVGPVLIRLQEPTKSANIEVHRKIPSTGTTQIIGVIQDFKPAPSRALETIYEIAPVLCSYASGQGEVGQLHMVKDPLTSVAMAAQILAGCQILHALEATGTLCALDKNVLCDGPAPTTMNEGTRTALAALGWTWDEENAAWAYYTGHG